MLPFMFLLPVLLALQVSASAVSPFGPLHQLLSRQTSSFIDPNTIPQGCESECITIVTSVNDCQISPTLGCGCTLQDERSFTTCINCLVGPAPSASLIESAQGYLDQYVAVCNAAGASLPAATISGGISLVTSTAVRSSIRASATFADPPRTFTGTQTPGLSPTLTLSGSGGGDDSDTSGGPGQGSGQGSGSGASNPLGTANGALRLVIGSGAASVVGVLVGACIVFL